MIIEYNTSVFTPAGWRSEVVRARAEVLTPARCRVTEVLLIGGERPCGQLSRTGAKRQTYNAKGVALREIGKTKLISRLLTVEAP